MEVGTFGESFPPLGKLEYSRGPPEVSSSPPSPPSREKTPSPKPCESPLGGHSSPLNGTDLELNNLALIERIAAQPRVIKKKSPSSEAMSDQQFKSYRSFQKIARPVSTSKVPASRPIFGCQLEPPVHRTPRSNPGIVSPPLVDSGSHENVLTAHRKDEYEPTLERTSMRANRPWWKDLPGVKLLRSLWRAFTVFVHALLQDAFDVAMLTVQLLKATLLFCLSCVISFMVMRPLRILCPDIYWICFSYSPSKRLPSAAEVKGAVLSSKGVQDEIGFTEEVLFDSRLNQMRVVRTINKEREKLANKIYSAMAADHSLLAVRIFLYFWIKVMRMMYVFGVHIDDDEVNRCVILAKDQPLLLIPNHKSHIDYIVLLYTAFRYNLPLPCVVAGDNLNMPVIGQILRWGGAIFIRRAFATDTDRLYGAVFTAYIQQLLRRGHSVQCFIEGGRSRSGKVLPPRAGLLRTVVDAVVDRQVLDVYVVPISISYDRIVENASHVDELAGKQKRRERLMRSVRQMSYLIASAATKVNCYGRVDIRFAAPFSLALYLESLGGAPVANSPATRRRDMANTLGYHILYECNRVATVQCVALLATVLLTHYRRGIPQKELVSQAQWLAKEIEDRGGNVVEMSNDLIQLVMRMVIGGSVSTNTLVKHHKDRLVVSLYNPRESMELNLYRNQLIHFFVLEALVCCAMYAAEKRSNDKRVLVPKQELLEKAAFLTSLLKIEFIYKPPALEANHENTLRTLVQRGVIEIVPDEDGDLVCVQERDDGEGGLGSGTHMYLFLCSLLWHYIDSYWLTALALFTLLPSRVTSELGFWTKVQTIGEMLYFDGQLDLCEAISRDAIQNALTLFSNWGVVEFITIEGSNAITHTKGNRIVRLHNAYQSEEAVHNLMLEIYDFRKRCRAYRSRRYRLTKTTDLQDALAAVKAFLADSSRRSSSPPLLIQKK